MMTSADGMWPEISWEQGELLEEDVDKRMIIYLMWGMDKAGNEYQGEGYYFHDEFNEVKNITKIR